MELLHAIVLGIIEGITEFLPVSSTGHLILTSRLLDIPQTNFLKSFEISIQLGAISAIFLQYGRTIFKERRLLINIAIAFIPAAIVGAIFYSFIKEVLFEKALVVIYALGIGGVILILLELFATNKNKLGTRRTEILKMDALIIGLFQAISVIPGVSRAGATIMGGLLRGIEREEIVKFSFLLAIPTILAATAYDFFRGIGSFTEKDLVPLLVGFCTALVTALFVTRAFLSFIKTRSFIPFGVYRIVAAIIFFLVLYV